MVSKDAAFEDNPAGHDRTTAVRGERARSDSERHARREAFLAAATAIWADTPYDRVTMQGVARHVGLAKGTLYLYFQTKEELFLAVLQRQLWSWFDTVDAQLAGSTGDPASTARHISGTLHGREDLIRLLALLGTALEQNVPEDTGLAFKTQLAQRLERTGHLLERHLGNLPQGQGQRAILHLNALVIGLHHATAPSPTRDAVQRDPTLAPLALDFHTELQVALEALLRGLSRNPSGETP